MDQHHCDSFTTKEGQKAKISVPCPNIIKSYNANMGGVDILDKKQLHTGLIESLPAGGTT